MTTQRFPLFRPDDTEWSPGVLSGIGHRACALMFMATVLLIALWPGNAAAKLNIQACDRPWISTSTFEKLFTVELVQHPQLDLQQLRILISHCTDNNVLLTLTYGNLETRTRVPLWDIPEKNRLRTIVLASAELLNEFRIPAAAPQTQGNDTDSTVTPSPQPPQRQDSAETDFSEHPPLSASRTTTPSLYNPVETPNDSPLPSPVYPPQRQPVSLLQQPQQPSGQPEPLGSKESAPALMPRPHSATQHPDQTKESRPPDTPSPTNASPRPQVPPVHPQPSSSPPDGPSDIQLNAGIGAIHFVQQRTLAPEIRLALEVNRFVAGPFVYGRGWQDSLGRGFIVSTGGFAGIRLCIKKGNRATFGWHGITELSAITARGNPTGDSIGFHVTRFAYGGRTGIWFRAGKSRTQLQTTLSAGWIHGLNAWAANRKLGGFHGVLFSIGIGISRQLR